MTEEKKTTKAKPITRAELEKMFARHDEEMAKKIDSMCDNCSHHDCECPGKIEALDNYTGARMDQLDENDELLRQNINKLATQTDAQIKELAEQSKGTLEALAGQVDEERRLRAEAEEKVTRLQEQLEQMKEESVANDVAMVKLENETKEQQSLLDRYREELDSNAEKLERNTADLTKVGAIAGALMGLALVLVALSIAGVI